MIIDAISNGIVIDHISAGKAMELYNILGLDKLDCSVALLKNVSSGKLGRKDIIKIDQVLDLDWDVIGYVDPGITVNIIKDGKRIEKRQLKLPERITNVIRCKNPRCITSVEQELPQIFSLTDETYSLLCSVKTPEGIDAGDMRFWIAILDHSYWILGSVLGTIIGGILPFDTTGIDFAMTSLFTVIFVEQWQSTKCHIPALMGLAAAAVSLAILGPDNFILPAMLAICVMLVAMRGRLAKEVA